MSSGFKELMGLLDKYQDKMLEWDYVEACNALKNEYEKSNPRYSDTDYMRLYEKYRIATADRAQAYKNFIDEIDRSRMVDQELLMANSRLCILYKTAPDKSIFTKQQMVHINEYNRKKQQKEYLKRKDKVSNNRLEKLGEWRLKA